MNANLLNPITKQLQNLENIIVKKENSLFSKKPKEEEEEKVKQELEQIKPSTSFQEANTNANIKADADGVGDKAIGDDDDDVFEDSQQEPVVSNVHQYHLVNDLAELKPLPRKYIQEMINDKDDIFDHTYGVRIDNNNQNLLIGNSNLDFIDADILIQKKRYKGTVGLYELLFKKTPRSVYSDADLNTYKNILLKTNAYKRNYKANEQIKGSKLQKYINIIAPLIQEQQQPKSTGKGLSKHKHLTLFSQKGLFKKVNQNSLDYVYWDDPNELINRLRLLIASQEAGNTSHQNEIVSIIEELREANIIE